jgi:hypothetical protein
VKARRKAYNQRYFSKPEVKARQKLIEIQKNYFKKEFKKQEQQRIFNILLKEQKSELLNPISK